MEMEPWLEVFWEIVVEDEPYTFSLVARKEIQEFSLQLGRHVIEAQYFSV